MEILGRTSSQSRVFAVNCNLETRLHHILTCFSILTFVTGSSARIYTSYSKDEIPTVPFVTFLCFAALLLYYCFELSQRIPPWKKSPKKHKLLIGIWLLTCALMIGFCFKFTELTRSSACFSFLGAVTGGNMLVLYLYSVWGDYISGKRPVTFESVDGNERISICIGKSLTSVC